jgi:putative effector of murein hydrolase LrgA (UPF0299 family)
MNPRFLLLSLLALLTVLRWLWLAPQDFDPSAAYLALCGYTPSIAYFDGPGATAVCTALGARWAGAGALGAALLWPVFAVFATFALYHLVAPLAGDRAASGTAVLLNLLPSFNTASVHPTCALPLTMFALGFAACAWRGLQNSSLKWWFGAGLCAAGGLLFDYLAWFFVPALAIVMLASHRWRNALLEPGFWLAAVLPLATFAWLLVWNAEHGWVHFIGGTWQTATTLVWRRLPHDIYDAAWAVSPLVLVALAAGFWFAIREIRASRKAKFLAIPALLAALIAVYLGLRGESTQAAGLVATALALPLLAWLPLPSAVIGLVLASAALWTAVSLGAMQPAAPTVTPQVVREIETLRAAQTTDSASPVFLIARDATLASALALHLEDTSFVTPGHPSVYIIESPYADSQYALWPRYDQFVDMPKPAADEAPDPFTEQDGANPFLWRSALYVTPQTPDALPQAITAAFASHRLLAEITTPSGEILRVYLCSEYETLPL